MRHGGLPARQAASRDSTPAAPFTKFKPEIVKLPLLKYWLVLRMKRLCLRLLLLFAAAPLCWHALAEPGVTAGEITFGEVAVFNGFGAIRGMQIRAGIVAAFEEANRAGGVKGRKLTLISEDDGHEPAISIQVAEKLVSSGKIFALIGSMGTATSEVIEPIASQAGVPFIAPFTGAQFLREPFNPNVVNLRASYLQETEAMVSGLPRTEASPASRFFIRMTLLAETACRDCIKRLPKEE